MVQSVLSFRKLLSTTRQETNPLPLPTRLGNFNFSLSTWGLFQSSGPGSLWALYSPEWAVRTPHPSVSYSGHSQRGPGSWGPGQYWRPASVRVMKRVWSTTNLVFLCQLGDPEPPTRNQQHHRFPITRSLLPAPDTQLQLKTQACQACPQMHADVTHALTHLTTRSLSDHLKKRLRFLRHEPWEHC